MRAITNFEQNIANAVVKLGLCQNWEFAAYLESPNGPLIEFVTRMRDDGADPSLDVQNKAHSGTLVVVHHNHLSQESLSSADWNGASKLFYEIYAHSADGTAYFGRVINHVSVDSVNSKYLTHEQDAENILFQILHQSLSPTQPAAELAGFFRKEVINQAMNLRNFVLYDVAWGQSMTPPPYVRPGNKPLNAPAGIWGSKIATHIHSAAINLAKKL